MTAKPKAFLLHGFMGTGKTTLAKKLESEHDAVRFTHDEWMNELFGDDPPEELFQEYARRISTVMQKTWTRCLDLGVNVVLDFGLWSRAERDSIRALVARHGGEPMLCHLNCTDDVAWQRIDERNRALGRSLFIAQTPFEC
ncbi:AAA family ATPase [Pleomorphomonas sp. PLEO]|uniref:AAA family ATPase n=1 Tax=Pleomorphomonas sp. PLEO TaxID=3239306 RepID=UPI00351F6E26